jgi:hypothetical protein
MLEESGGGGGFPWEWLVFEVWVTTSLTLSRSLVARSSLARVSLYWLRSLSFSDKTQVNTDRE